MPKRGEKIEEVEMVEGKEERREELSGEEAFEQISLIQRGEGDGKA